MALAEYVYPLIAGQQEAQAPFVTGGDPETIEFGRALYFFRLFCHVRNALKVGPYITIYNNIVKYFNPQKSFEKQGLFGKIVP